MAPALGSGDPAKRVSGKLTKHRKEGHQVTMQLPERFKDGDDAEDDVTKPKGHRMLMNQSVFGMIAAAGSQVDFNARFDGQSSDDEDEATARPTREHSTEVRKTLPHAISPTSSTNHRKRLSGSKLVQSLPGIGITRSRKDSTSKHTNTSRLLEDAGQAEDVPQIAHEARSIGSSPSPSRPPPVMSQMLEAKAELSQRPSFEAPRDPLERSSRGMTVSKSSLAIRLMEIFAFAEPEEVIEEYPCWLMKSVLLQGYMYITQRHICFYAYLPKHANEVVKSGYLYKRGQKNPKYNRYWFRLKGDVLSYYTDPSDLYFPRGNIDLRYAISASVTDREKNKDGTHFTLTTHQKKYYFQADSMPSAKEWVKSLQKIIFRSHNEGDSVKISLPIANVIDIEDSQVVEFAETCKVRVIDNEDTYAIDEYFFSFFNFGLEAMGVLRHMVEDATAWQAAASETLLKEPSITPGHLTDQQQRIVVQQTSTLTNASTRNPSSALEEDSQATMPPITSPNRATSKAGARESRSDFELANIEGRLSFDYSRPGSCDAGCRRSLSTDKRSHSHGRIKMTRQGSERHDSSDSFDRSMDGTSSGIIDQSDVDAQESDIRMLGSDDVLFAPTIQRSVPTQRHETQDMAASTILQPLVEMSVVDAEHSSLQRQADCIPATTPYPSRGDNTSTQTLHAFVKAGAYPLSRAAGFAGYLNRHSKRMSNLLATESMGYVEKVSGMWKGGQKHYDDPAGAGLDEELEADDDAPGEATRERFREHFALPASEILQATYFAYLHRVLPLYGKVYISDRSFCFRSLLPGTRTKLILPLTDIENVNKENGFRFGYSGLVVVIRGYEEVFFEFGKSDLRDDCCITLLQGLENTRWYKDSESLTTGERQSADLAMAEHMALQRARQKGLSEHDIGLPSTIEKAQPEMPTIMFDDPRASILNFKPIESLRITCLTIGSRGDVQPYIALCKGLLAEGHKVKIATHKEFESWVNSHGIEFAPVEGDPAELMRICVDNGMFTYSFLKEASATFRTWIDELCSSAWLACQNTDVLIESPSAMAGIHIAEALQIPYFRAFTMPWTRTRAYPHAFAVPDHKLGGAYNYITYVMFDNVFWKAIAGQMNRWRKKELGLGRTSLEKMQPNKVPFLYNFSPSVVVPPSDYPDWIRVTGYWFLDEGIKWQPPHDLVTFIVKARAVGRKIVYIGFGSIVVPDSRALTQTIVDSVLKADVCCILSKGWSDRLDKKASTEPEVPLPADIFLIKSAPHDWLFKQIDAAAHHGGAGTTGASLRAGIPTIIKPFFGDQFFYGSRVEDLGVGIYMKNFNVSVFSRALWEATHSERMIIKAKVLGEQIRSENGVDAAIEAIYRDLEYARSLIKRRDVKALEDGFEGSIEESWTFIDDDTDPELVRKTHEGAPFAPEQGRGDMTPRKSVDMTSDTQHSDDSSRVAGKSSSDDASAPITRKDRQA